MTDEERKKEQESWKSDQWQFYKYLRYGKWRWRRTAANNDIVGASTQGYHNKADMYANARRNGYTGPEE